MNVLLQRQEPGWVHKLRELCKQDSINIYDREHESKDIHLLVTDYPPQMAGKGIFSKIPFLVVSKEKSEEKILEAFDMGAEDYMIYPISPRIARVRILRILNHYKMEEDYLKNLQRNVGLTPNEYKILSCMMTRPGKVFSRNELIEGAFSGNYEGYDRNIDNYIKQIRKKLQKKSSGQEKIETVYGVGYRYIP